MPEPVALEQESKHNGRASSSFMTYEEFLDSADEDVYAEWVDGEVIELSPANRVHQTVVDFLAAVLKHFVENSELGLVLSAPFQMKTGPDLPGREPDVLFIAAENLHRLKDSHLEGPADLVVEVTSRESRARDRGQKLYEYEEGGVREYWLIDPERKETRFYQRGADGAFDPVSTAADGIYRSAVLEGLWIKVDWVLQESPPPLMQVLKEWGLV